MPDDLHEALLNRLARLGHAVPGASLEAVCARLESLPSGAGREEVLSTLPGIPNAAARAALEKVTSAWYDAVPGGHPLALAWALRSACAVDEWWRKSRGLELVWTGPTNAAGVLRRTEQAILEVIGSAQRELWLISFAAYKVPTIRDALLAAVERGVLVRLVLESSEESAGKLTFDALKGIGVRVAEVTTVYEWPLERRPRNAQGKIGALHVKCCLADDSVLFVSSANLTEYALALNMELGVLIRGGTTPRLTFEHFRWLAASRVLVAAHSG